MLPHLGSVARQDSYLAGKKGGSEGNEPPTVIAMLIIYSWIRLIEKVPIFPTVEHPCLHRYWESEIYYNSGTSLLNI
jgi:hypothetical protein